MATDSASKHFDSSESEFSTLAKKDAEVERVLGIKLATIKANAKDPQELITIDPDVDYSDLLKSVQEVLKKKETVYGPPCMFSHSEAIRTRFVEPVLCDALFYAKKKNGLNTFTCTAVLEPEWPVDDPMLQNTGEGRADYAIFIDNEEVRMGQMKSSRKKSVVIVEVKKSRAIDGLGQCFLGMKSTYDEKLKEVVYGASTDGADWIICKFDGKTFEISYPISVMKGISKYNWMLGEGANLVKILHTLFDRQIQRVLMKPDEDDEEMEAQNELVSSQRDRDEKAIKEAAAATAAWVAKLGPGDQLGLEEEVKTLNENLQKLISLVKRNK